MASTSAVQLGLGDSSQQAMPDRRRRWEDLGLVFGIGFLPLVVSAIYQLFFPIEGTPRLTNYRFGTGLTHEIGVLFLFAILLRRQGRRVGDMGLSFQWLDILRGAGLVAGAWIFSGFVAATIRLIYFWSGSQLHYRDPGKIFGGFQPALFLIYTLAAPFFEEILVRGYLMTELIGLSWPVWLATLISVGLQTSYHLYYGVVGALGVGAGFLLLGIYYAKTRRLMPVVLAHLFWDLAATYSHLHR